MPKTVTEKQLVANRANASLGGVKTVEGKNVSKMNALKHGIFCQKVLLNKQEEESYKTFMNYLVNEHSADGFYEIYLLSKVVECMIKIARLDWIEAKHYNKNKEAEEENTRKFFDYIITKQTIKEHPLPEEKHPNNLTDKEIEAIAKVVGDKLGIEQREKKKIDPFDGILSTRDMPELSRIQEYRDMLENRQSKYLGEFMKVRYFKKNM